MKITGADSSLVVSSANAIAKVPVPVSAAVPAPVLSNCALNEKITTAAAVPDACPSSRSAATSDADAVPVSPPSSKKNECLEDIQRLTDEELEFDEFLMDAAEWL